MAVVGVALVDRALLSAEEEEPLVAPHPRTGRPRRLAVARGGRALFAVARHADAAPASWLLGGAVLMDGGLAVAAPVHPLLVLLAAVEYAAPPPPPGAFVPLADWLAGAGVDAARLRRVAGCAPARVLDECRPGAGLPALYRRSDARALAWLEARHRRAAAALLGRPDLRPCLRCADGAHGPPPPGDPPAAADAAFSAYAALRDALPPRLADALRARLGLRPDPGLAPAGTDSLPLDARPHVRPGPPDPPPPDKRHRAAAAAAPPDGARPIDRFFARRT